MRAQPGWEDPDQWLRMIQINTDIACTVAGVIARSGGAAQAEKLMDQIIQYHETLISKIAHAERLAPIDCWVIKGDYDKALDTLDGSLLFSAWRLKDLLDLDLVDHHEHATIGKFVAAIVDICGRVGPTFRPDPLAR